VRILSPIKDHHSERRLFIARVVFASVVAAVLLGVVIARLVQLQVFNYEHFAERAQGNRIRIEAVPPIRGLIMDRKGRVLAENRPAYQLELIPEQVEDIDGTLTRLAELKLIDAEEIEHFKALIASGLRFKPVTLKLRMSDEEVALFAVQRPRFPGVDFRPRLIRHYPNGPAIAHAVGYVGALSETDLLTLDPARYAGTGQTGKTGVEMSFESVLHGDPGYRHVVTNARGRVVTLTSGDMLESLPVDAHPSPGSNLFLSLDLDLQLVAYNALTGQRGAVVAIDPWSGEILALVSTPSFDPNLFATGMSSAQFNALQTDLDRPLFDRAVRGTYPPGSTIKPMLALAALASGATNLTKKTMCIGYFRLPNSTHRYRDWRPEGHGRVDLHDAIEQSCDVYFYEVSVDLGIDNMHTYLDQFGLGKPSGIDVPGEREGINPSRAWKERTFGNPSDQRWFNGETVIASIGQGYMLATPLQLASAAATLATRGTRFRPHLVAAWEDPLTGERTLLSPERIADVTVDNEFYWQTVIEAMHGVMQGERGTARAVGSGAPYSMAGKSGTAQVFSVAQEDEYNENEIEYRLRDHALFISFAPVGNPQIAVAVIVENGSSGSRVAAPIARAVMDRYIGAVDAT
jgi:penicillin-binding protein 2